MGRLILLLALLVAVVGAAALLVVPEQPALGLGLGVLSAVMVVAAPPRRVGPVQRPGRGRSRPMTRRGLLLAAVTLLVAGAAAIRREELGRSALTASPPPDATPPYRPLPSPTTRPAGQGIWLSPDEIAALPTDTEAFGRLENAAAGEIRLQDISNQDSRTPSHLMAAALVAARRNDRRLREAVRDAIQAGIGTENGDTGGHRDRNRPLAIGRNLPGYVIAADLIGLRAFDRSTDDRFRSWLDGLRTKDVEGAEWSLAAIEPLDHSNWGAHISAAMTAANLYLEDTTAIGTSADILRGWLGDPEGRQDWEYDTERHDYSWMCHYPDVDRFLPVNPAGCEREGMVIDGIIPIDMQRGGGFRVPPRFTRYPRESLQGRTAQAEMLYRAGYDTFGWADRALLRIAERQRAMGEEFDRDWYEPDMGCYWIIARRTGAGLPLEEPSTGRSVSGVDWTHAFG
jgi:hypothetical protein